MEVNAMPAISAVDVANLHLGLLLRIIEHAHASPLPRILTCICKENIFTLNVEAAVVLVCNLCVVVWEILAKNTLAVVRPER